MTLFPCLPPHIESSAYFDSVTHTHTTLSVSPFMRDSLPNKSIISQLDLRIIIIYDEFLAKIAPAYGGIGKQKIFELTHVLSAVCYAVYLCNTVPSIKYSSFMKKACYLYSYIYKLYQLSREILI